MPKKGRAEKEKNGVNKYLSDLVKNPKESFLPGPHIF